MERCILIVYDTVQWSEVLDCIKGETELIPSGSLLCFLAADTI